MARIRFCSVRNQTICRLRRRNPGVIGGIKSRDGTLLGDDNGDPRPLDRVLFGVNQSVQTIEDGRNSGLLVVENIPTNAEVTESVRSCKSGKATCVDEVVAKGTGEPMQ